jgi:non-lysosomal glucosylceramidase
MSCENSGCGCGPSRREALKVMGLAATAALGAARSSVGFMAGPFERRDFDKLVPADKKLSPEWVKSLFDRGEPTVHQGDDLKFIGMPVGGLCAGQLYLGGDGKLWRWDLFNAHLPTGSERYAHPNKTGLPIEQGFAIRVAAGDQTQTRTLDAKGFPQVSFLGQYPIGTVEYKEANFPVSITLEAFSPFIPLNVDDSSLPATVLRFTLTNGSKDAVEATLTGWLQNAVLPNDPWVMATRRNRIVRRDGITFLNCSVERPAVAAQPAEPDVAFEDWNKDSYEGWTVEGTAFGARPAKRSEAPSYMGSFGEAAGERFINTHITGSNGSIAERDGQTGKLTSNPFTIDRRFINFPIGGGSHKGRTCVNLLVDGKIVQSAVGADDNRMKPQVFDVRSLRGKQARIEIVDNDKGPWGNIGVGPITFSDLPAGAKDLESMAGHGTMGLALLGADAAPDLSFATVRAGMDGAFTTGTPGDDASQPFDQALVGSLGRKLHLPPGQSATIDYVLTWHFPNLELDRLGKVGRHYATKFDSAQAVATYVAKEFPRLTAQTKLWRDTWYDSTLPHWFLDRTFLNISILATSTAYRFADGRFYAWEGVGCCAGTCTHVWHYAQAMSRLFPELERITREHVDLGVGFNEKTGVMGFRAEFDRGLAVDGQSGTLLRFYREHLMSADDAFLKRTWPRIKEAFQPLLKLDADRDGIMQGAQMNTLDLPWYGKIAWLSSLYVAALRAGERMARHMGELDFADRCRATADRGADNLVRELFEGEYFVNKVDPRELDKVNSGTGCEIDQVFGQSWAFQVGLGRILPERETRSALRSLWKYNFTPDVGPYRQAYIDGRWYAMPGEAGLLMCTFPRNDWDYNNARGKGPRGLTGYFNECMNGFEHQVAGHMLWEGMVQEGLAIERALHERYGANRRNPWNEIECGDHYSRSMASHGVFLAACGFEHDGPAGTIGFAPRLTPEDFRAPFTSAQGWGAYRQKRDGVTQTASIKLASGKLRVQMLRFEVGPKARVSSVSINVGGKDVPVEFRQDGKSLAITLSDMITFAAGESLNVEIR